MLVIGMNPNQENVCLCVTQNITLFEFILPICQISEGQRIEVFKKALYFAEPTMIVMLCLMSSYAVLVLHEFVKLGTQLR